MRLLRADGYRPYASRALERTFDLGFDAMP